MQETASSLEPRDEETTFLRWKETTGVHGQLPLASPCKPAYRQLRVLARRSWHVLAHRQPRERAPPWELPFCVRPRGHGYASSRRCARPLRPHARRRLAPLRSPRSDRVLARWTPHTHRPGARRRRWPGSARSLAGAWPHSTPALTRLWPRARRCVAPLLPGAHRRRACLPPSAAIV
jgi:hypothetical protein